MLIEQIRAATQNEHELLEQALFPYLQKIQHQHDYVVLLQAFYGFLHPVEEMITQFIDTGLLPDMPLRRSSSKILDDLKSLADEALPPVTSQLPYVHNSPTAFGALYVLEGSTLGGKIIAKTITEKLGTSTGLSFFKGYGAETGTMWKNFLHHLENEYNQSQHQQVVKTATDTFRLFGLWLQQKLPLKTPV